MNRRTFLQRAAALPFVGGVAQAIASRPEVVKFEPLQTALRWVERMGWKPVLYETEQAAKDGWYAAVLDRAGKLVGWLTTGGRFLPAPERGL